ncbi:MAG TPA: hypothetical protein VIM11_03665 [Tepidisphaeraceae bacterium]|jgi:hypothetical protein
MRDSTDDAVRKIRDLCQELADRHGLDRELRDEMCGHLEDKLAGYLRGDVRISEDDALLLVRAHFGNAEQIARTIGRESSGAAEKFLTSQVNHARLYSVLAIILGVSTMLTIPLALLVWVQRQYAWGPKSPGRIPNWALPWSAAISGMYVVLILLTLFARRLNPGAGRRLTRMLNYVLLPAVPFGTLLGIYGLMKVDKGGERQIV